MSYKETNMELILSFIWLNNKIHNYLPSCSWDFLKLLPVAQLFKNLRTVWKPKNHQRVQTTLPWSIPWARWTQSTPLHSFSVRLSLTLPSQLCLGLTYILFLSGQTKSYMHYLIPRTCYMLHDFLLDFTILIIRGKSTYFETPHYAVFWNLLQLHWPFVLSFLHVGTHMP
jgi:hypothetical protein